MAESEYELAEGVEVIVFGRPMCSDCDAAEKVLHDIQVPFTHINIVKDAGVQKQVTKICEAFGRGPAVPVIVIHHHTQDVNGEIVFIEPRELGLVALANTVKALRVPTPKP